MSVNTWAVIIIGLVVALTFAVTLRIFPDSPRSTRKPAHLTLAPGLEEAGAGLDRCAPQGTAAEPVASPHK